MCVCVWVNTFLKLPLLRVGCGFIVYGFREMLFSFGGLLMLLQGDSSDAKKLELDQRLFLLMKKV